MLVGKRFFIVNFIVCIINTINQSIIYSAQQTPEPVQQVAELTRLAANLRAQLETLSPDLAAANKRMDDLFRIADAFVDSTRTIDDLTHCAAEHALQARTNAKEFESRIEALTSGLRILEEQAQIIIRMNLLNSPEVKHLSQKD